MPPVLSILVPTFNSEFTISKTIESLISISEIDIEILISDHSSNDNTVDFVKKFSDPRIFLRTEPRENSVGSHWTNLSRLARGRYVKLVCADDLIECSSVINQIEILEKFSNVNLVATTRDIISDSGKILLKSRGLKFLSGFHNGKDAITKSILTGTNQFGEPACVMFRNSALQRSLPWNDKYPYVIDLDMYARILAIGDFYGLAESGAKFRVSKNSWSSQLAKVQSPQFNSWVSQINIELNLTLTTRQLLKTKIKSKSLAVIRSLFEKFTI